MAARATGRICTSHGGMGGLGCPLRLIERDGATIAQGRNVGIAAARASIIAVTDAGVRLDARWLEHLRAPFDDPSVSVCGGFFVPDPQHPVRGRDGRDRLARARTTSIPRHFSHRAGASPFARQRGRQLAATRNGSITVRTLSSISALRETRSAQRIRPGGNRAIPTARHAASVLASVFPLRARRWQGEISGRKRHAARYATYSALIGLGLLGKHGRWLWPAAIGGAWWYVRRPYQRLARGAAFALAATATHCHHHGTHHPCRRRSRQNVRLSGWRVVARPAPWPGDGTGATPLPPHIQHKRRRRSTP